MLLVRILLGLLLGYALLVFLAWVFQERIAFPAPRASVPDPRQVGAANGERIELALRDGTKLAGWYLRPRSPPGSRPPWPALLWFYGNGENIASIGPIVRDFQPPGAALLVAPLTNALDIAREHYALFPRFIVRLRLDNLANLRQVRCPVLVFHGTADRLAPLAMGRRVVAAAPGPAELVLIQGAGHNDTYDLGGETYRRRLWQFVLGGAAVR